jgi:sugar/nucleoside kinase (ribokinase family)
MIGAIPDRFVVVGDIVTDIVAVHSGPIVVGSDTPTAIRMTGGGSAANTAAWLASLGASVSLVGVVGADAAGADRIAELEAAGVDCTHVRRAEEGLTGSIIVLAHSGERTFLCDRAANELLDPSDVDRALAGGASHLHLSGYPLLHAGTRTAARHALAAARASGATTSVDAASAAPLRLVGRSSFLDWIRGVDILFANRDEAAILGPVDGIDNVVVKLGRDGARWTGMGGGARVPAVPVERVIDATGAGDAFAAAFLLGWRRGEPPDGCLRAAAELGAAACAVLGGRPVTPVR